MTAQGVRSESAVPGSSGPVIPAPRGTGGRWGPDPLSTFSFRPENGRRRGSLPILAYSTGLVALDALGMGGALAEFSARIGILVCAVTVILILNASAGLYEYRRAPSAFSAAPPLCFNGSTALCSTLFMAVTVRPWEFSPAELKSLPAAFALYLMATCLGRCVYFAVIRRARCRVGRGHRTLVIGTGRTADRISSVLKEHPEYGLEPRGFVELTDANPQVPLHLPILGGPRDLRRIITMHRIDTVVAPMEEGQGPDLDTVIRACAAMGCRVILAPSYFATSLVGSSRVEYLQGIPTAALARQPFHCPSWSLKRALDVIVAVCALVFSLPVFGLCALLVRLDGGPGVIFRQRRVGLHGRPFVLFKFRTLKPSDDEEANTRWSIENDERIGPLGRFLRATSLDELPQLWNVVRGEMSLVGPRPERPHFVHYFSAHIPAYAFRHRVPSGLTGWAQVHGLRGDTSIHERVRLDNHYIENWSVWGDIRILVMTLRTLLPRKR